MLKSSSIERNDEFQRDLGVVRCDETPVVDEYKLRFVGLITPDMVV